ncbi:RNA polymerase sigma-70 factor, ECF subfamily [Chitinophaga eiseniae]|uniref:RNA polymerase sigma-70 factor, ECF subfamily n=1 Tax=Chitinophaga eiseniae TaxID=634771 RepID=A0A1T4T6J0_9BACT|nr:RNA polymerase sigma-70 factor [Chitinophaga eiseniae]SKA36023.1 RNA polymerase sigma-70 factor, ECF subfamily [Chitinophaga eiseniae]
MSSSILRDTPETELWQLVRQGSVPAYEALYERHWETLYETAYWRLYDKDAAKDIVQEVFIYCWQKREQIQITESVVGYFRTAVRFKVLNHLKSEQARDKYRQLAGRELPEITHSTEEMMAGADLEASYRRELQRLPEKMRQLFIDSRDHGLSVREIAQKHGLSEQTVKNQLSAALKKLRDGLGNFFFE